MMRSSFRFAVIAAICAVFLGAATAEARPGGGMSFGSRGSRTFSMPGPSPTAPGPIAPIQRSMTQPGQTPGMAPASPFGGFGLGRGLLAGLIGGGLIGLLLGNGMGSIFWLILQVGAIFLLVRFAMSFFGRRAAFAGNASPAYQRTGYGPLGGSAGPSTQPVTVNPSDYAEFERLLAEIQSAYGREDVGTLRRLTTPEMATYFEEELAANAARGLVNKVSGGKLVRGDLSEAWREAGADYATVAMRFEILDTMVERASGRIVSGDPTKPELITEVWTFRRPIGGAWQLSAIQQTR
ncbi:MAG: TIM44-like domain-containing protein [Hyphomicrobiales bacterium]|nr:TIM44-like domain-containing protein [Hyphomicrobiales bacterium]